MTLHLQDVVDYVEAHIGDFHHKRLEKLETLRLEQVLFRKNPYLFKAKNILTAESIVRSILDAYLSSQEETLFGDFLEGLAVFVCHRVYGGVKPDSAQLTGIDLISGNDNLYIEIIEPLGHRAKERNAEFDAAYARIINRFTLNFAQKYCLPDGAIDWPKIAAAVSQRNADTGYPF